VRLVALGQYERLVVAGQDAAGLARQVVTARNAAMHMVVQRARAW